MLGMEVSVCAATCIELARATTWAPLRAQSTGQKGLQT